MNDLEYLKSQAAHHRRRASAVRRMKSLSMALTPSERVGLRSRTQSGVTGRSFGSGQVYGYVSLVGRREAMEDTLTVAPPGWPKEDYSFFAVYDGHGGVGVAEKCGEGMHVCLEKVIKKAKDACADSGLFDWGKVMEDCFSTMDGEILSGCGGRDKGMGSTAVVVLVGKEDVVAANCGDSRAVLSRGQAVLPLSMDHKPDREDERERIEAAGGKVLFWNGWRVEGVLSTSRSLGDVYLKPFVSSEPEVTVVRRSHSDEFLIIASDGLFDVMSNESACDVVRNSLRARRHMTAGAASEAASLLAEVAIAKGSADNITAIVVPLASLT